MEGFEINIPKVNMGAQELEACIKEIDRITSAIDKIQKNLRTNMFIANSSMYGDLAKKRKIIADTGTRTRNLLNGLNRITDTYQRTESQLCKNDIKEKAKIVGLSGALISGDYSISNKDTDSDLSLHGELLGYSTSGKVTSGIGWKEDKDGNMVFDSLDLIKAEGTIEGHLAKGSFDGRTGIVSVDGEAEIGKVEAKGSVGASLFSDGRFTPGLNAKAEVSATAVTGKINATAGDDNLNAHIGAKGDALTAKAKAEAKLGAITIENKDGSKSTAYGAKVEAGAEAYLAQGEVSGGFTIFGIKIDGSIGGKIGGAGAKANASVSNKGVSGKVGLGLGLGLEVGISIDWSNFKFGWW